MKRPRRLCNFRGPSRERLIDSRRLFIAVTSSTKRICKKYQESLKIVEYPLHQLIRLGRLEIHIALSLRASSPIWASPLARSRETRFTRPNRRACSQAISLFQIPTSMSESSLRVTVLPSFIVYPYFELDIDQDEIGKALLNKQETEWIESFCSFCQFLVFWSNSHTGCVY